jgi:hypothetical protein
LRELNAQRRKKQIERAVSDDKETASVFTELLKSDPTLSALFSMGDRLVTGTGPGSSAPFIGRRFPTYFRLAKEPKQGLVKHCPVDRTCRAIFETDAANDYFERSDSRGEITSTPSVIEHSHLWNGEFTAKFAVPWNLEPGQQTKVTVCVTDVETDAHGHAFESSFTIVADPPLGPGVESSPGTAHRPTRPQQNGRTTSPRLAVPEVREEKLHDKPYSALRISHNDDGGYDFYLNVDNKFLSTELTRAKEDDRPLVKFWFKYGLALCALGMIQESKRQAEAQEKAADNGGLGDGEDLQRISGFCNGIARVIVPVIRALYRGPQPAVT